MTIFYDDIITIHEDQLPEGDVVDEYRNLPYIYWLPEQHKSPQVPFYGI